MELYHEKKEIVILTCLFYFSRLRAFVKGLSFDRSSETFLFGNLHFPCCTGDSGIPLGSSGHRFFFASYAPGYVNSRIYQLSQGRRFFFSIISQDAFWLLFDVRCDKSGAREGKRRTLDRRIIGTYNCLLCNGKSYVVTLARTLCNV